MLVAVYPAVPTRRLTEALAEAGWRAVPVADAVDLVERRPAEGWPAMVIELGDEPELGLAMARRAGEVAGVPVVLVVGPDQVRLLDRSGGFDDFVIDPPDPDELVVRMRRVAGGSWNEPADDIIRFKDLELNLGTYQATVAGRPVDLTYMEYELLRFFATNRGRAWTREQILSRVWGYDYFGGARTVDVHVRRLRAKLGEERASWITTIRSVGYRFG